MKTIKLKYCDFVDGFNPEVNCFITVILKKYGYNIEFSDDPDYVVYSVWGNSHMNYDCVKIFYTAEDVTPDFNFCDYAIGFDNINFGDRYIRFALFPFQYNFNDAVNKHLFTDDDLKNKTEFCDYVVSNGKGAPIRTEIFYKLSEYKKVDSGGKYLNNIGGPVEDKAAFQKKHKFSIAFENGSQSGYTTEKIIHSFAAKNIPIYWGNPDIGLDFNPESFINVMDFDSLDSVVDYVKKVDNDDELYRHILSQPIFKDGIVPERFRMSTVEQFVLHIFEQPVEKAFRRSFHTWRGIWVSEIKEKEQVIKRSRKLLPRIALRLTK